MSLHVLAQHLAAQGRGGDTELVHMNKDEVAGLRSIALQHGFDMPINPHTGLPEASWLSKLWNEIKPIAAPLAGLALNYFAPGIGSFLTDTVGLGAGTAAALTSPIGIGATVGGLTGLATGSLSQGLQAGLGAYGGAALGGAFTGAGTQALTQAGLAANPEAVAAQQAAMSTVAGGGQLTAEQISQLNAQYAAAQQAAAAQAAANPLSTMGKGIADTFSSPSSAFQFAKNNMTPTAAAVLPVVAGLSSQTTTKMPTLPPEAAGYIRPYYNGVAQTPILASSFGNQQLPNQGTAFNPNMLARINANPLTSQQAYNEMMGIPTTMAGGGLSHAAPHMVSLRGPTAELHGVERLMKYSSGGISNLGSYSDGGQLLRGPGDGVSDNIPAQIGEHQPARLAEGEFVVPARIVSELGNGSTNAGAKQLYAMIDRVQKGRSKTMGGKHAYAKDSNAEQFLPA